MTNSSHKVCSRIYVACLAAYNNGQLHGEWIDANQDATDIYNQIKTMLAKSPEPFAEEWAVHDYEGFGGIDLSEWPDIERVAALAKLIAEHGDAFAVWYQYQDGYDFEVTKLEEKFLEQWQGAFESETAFACQFLEDIGQLAEIPAWAQNYFDYESYARDLRLNGDFSFINRSGEIYVYSNNH
jgi:antirestriction protein